MPSLILCAVYLVVATLSSPTAAIKHCPNNNLAKIQKTIGFEKGVSIKGDGALIAESLYFYRFAPKKSGASLTGLDVIPNTPPTLLRSDELYQTISGKAVISANYPDTNLTRFDLTFMYIGCSLTVTDNLGLAKPQACTVDVKGYYAGGGGFTYDDPDSAIPVCAFQATYNPPLLAVGNAARKMSLVKAPDDCQGLFFLTIEATIKPAAEQVSVDILLDSSDVTLHDCS